MKLNNKIYRTLVGEPFLEQEINGKTVGFYYMNDTPFLSQYVSRGRFYLWTSNGNDYKLLIEKGFYEKVTYFFEQEINTIWLNFLDEVGGINSKMTKIFFGLSIGIAAVVITIFALIPKLDITIGVVVALFATLVVNTVHTTRVNKIVREKNVEAQMKIKSILKDEGFNQLIKDQEDYMKEYFKFEEDEEFDDEFENEVLVEDIDSETEEVEEIEVVEDNNIEE